MEEYSVNCWEEFENRLQGLESARNEKSNSGSSPSEYLFRGHSNSTWELETTLERFTSTPLSLTNYYRFALVASKKISVFTGVKWDIPSLEEYGQWLKDKDLLSFYDFKAYEYLAYLRHHGFPSPLLDWSQSPYIAAFFAFRTVDKNASNVAIYAYQDHSGAKIKLSDIPCIHRLGPYVSAHKRHFLQQSQYTFCTENNDNAVLYTRHQKVFSRNNQEQDLLWKFIIPVSQRKSFLAQLYKMNINSYSLFGSEDSLLESIALSDIYLRAPDL